ncbi:MAG: TetR/AcrR family transcriptional regulator, partial [Polyangiaceae bacterium]|nr:TetR/AcrR family transcriptional regulator [Polyangiaceae bacterium]
LETRSFREISIDDLARGAGLSRSSFYFYFPSKEAVLMTLLDRLVAQTDAAAQALIDRDPARYLRDALEGYFMMFAAHRVVLLAGNEAATSLPEVRELWNGARESWVRVSASAIDAERKRGAAPAGLPARDLAYALIRMNEGVLLSTFAGEQPSLPANQVVDVLETIWRNSIYGGQASYPSGRRARSNAAEGC